MAVRKLCLVQLLDTSPILQQTLLFDGERDYWVHPINVKRDTYGEFHHLFADLKKDEERFRTYFRMSSETFHLILNLVYLDIEKQETNYRKPIPPDERLALTLR